MEKWDKQVVIIGAGMSGLLAALLIKKRNPSIKILIVEASDQLGGNYAGLQLPGFGYCDSAMRLMYETGIPEMDEILRGILPADDWSILTDNEKDIAGIYWQASLQHNSAYIDLRRLPEPIYTHCEKEILDRSGTLQNFNNAQEHLIQRFGETTARYLIAALEKLYRTPASKLDVSATHQPAMNRVVLYNEDKTLPLLEDEALRALIAWPEQLTLPIKRLPSQAALYPKRFGTRNIVKALHKQLENMGVQIIFNCRIDSFEIKERAISTVVLSDGQQIQNPSALIAANGLFSSLKMLDQTTAAPFSPSPCWMVFLRLSAPVKMGELYHFYCLDAEYTTFRVTNYHNYCDNAYDGTGYPICVELWSEDESEMPAIDRAIAELRQMGILTPDCQIVTQAAVRTQNLHAFCSVEHVRIMQNMREELKAQKPDNMIVAGPFAEDGVMLLYEVWRDMYNKCIAYGM